MRAETIDREESYDATYYFGNTVVHIVAPEPKTPEKVDNIIEEHHKVGWEIWNDILKEETNKG